MPHRAAILKGWVEYMRTKSKGLELPRDPLMTEEDAAPQRDLEALVRRFDPSRRRAVRRLVFSSPRVADLAAVFPGAVYALAVRRGAATRRRRALDLVERGAQLKEVAQTLDLPFWLRRLPPEAFVGSAPRASGHGDVRSPRRQPPACDARRKRVLAALDRLRRQGLRRVLRALARRPARLRRRRRAGAPLRLARRLRLAFERRADTLPGSHRRPLAPRDGLRHRRVRRQELAEPHASRAADCATARLPIRGSSREKRTA